MKPGQTSVLQRDIIIEPDQFHQHVRDEPDQVLGIAELVSGRHHLDGRARRTDLLLLGPSGRQGGGRGRRRRRRGHLMHMALLWWGPAPLSSIFGPLARRRGGHLRSQRRSPGLSSPRAQRRRARPGSALLHFPADLDQLGGQVVRRRDAAAGRRHRPGAPAGELPLHAPFRWRGILRARIYRLSDGR